MHISSQGGLTMDENLAKVQRARASLTTLSMELFLELGDDFWVDESIRLTESSSTVQLIRSVLTTCPRLTNLQLYSPRATSVDTIPLLAQCLMMTNTTSTAYQQQQQLTSLAITRCVRLDSIQTVQLFARTIRSCRQLADFKLIHPHHCSTVSLDPIVAALAELPHLHSLDITLFHSDDDNNNNNNDQQMDNNIATTAGDVGYTPNVAGSNHRTGNILTTSTSTTMAYVSPAVLHKLLQAPCLTALSLWGCGIHDDHLHVLQHTTNHRLTFLSLRRNPHIRDWKPFYHSLLTNFGLKALYNDHADLMSCTHPTLPHHTPETDETAAVCAAEICLALNRLGRGMDSGGGKEEDDINDWLDMVASVSEASLALYFLLRSRPDAWCERGRSCRRIGPS